MKVHSVQYKQTLRHSWTVQHSPTVVFYTLLLCCSYTIGAVVSTLYCHDEVLGSVSGQGKIYNKKSIFSGTPGPLSLVEGKVAREWLAIALWSGRLLTVLTPAGTDPMDVPLAYHYLTVLQSTVVYAVEMWNSQWSQSSAMVHSDYVLTRMTVLYSVLYKVLLQDNVCTFLPCWALEYPVILLWHKLFIVFFSRHFLHCHDLLHLLSCCFFMGNKTSDFSMPHRTAVQNSRLTSICIVMTCKGVWLRNLQNLAASGI